MNKKHMEECMKPHTMLHSMFGLGIGILIASALQFSMSLGVIIGLIVLVAEFLGDWKMGMKKK